MASHLLQAGFFKIALSRQARSVKYQSFFIHFWTTGLCLATQYPHLLPLRRARKNAEAIIAGLLRLLPVTVDAKELWCSQQASTPFNHYLFGFIRPSDTVELCTRAFEERMSQTGQWTLPERANQKGINY